MWRLQERSRMAGVLVVSVVVAAFVLNSSAGPSLRTVDTAQLHSMIVDNAYRLEGGRAQPFTIIDARAKEEYDESHIFSAVNIPEKDFEKSMDFLPKNKDTLLVVYDDGPKPGTSGNWAEKAAAAGYANVVLYSEGFPAWKRNKMPVAPLGNGH